MLFFFIYHLKLYRRKVVLENLKKSFPEKSEKEIEEIAKKFFSHFCDVIIESIKGFHISEKEILKRHSYSNVELLNSYYEKKQSVAIVGAHYCNWEWVALSLPLVTKFKTHGIFQPLTNAAMNVLIKGSRERNGMKLVAFKEVPRVLEETKNELITMGYILDQSPGRSDRHHKWIRFLNQDTKANGTFEFLAKKHNTPVIYMNVTKKKRGYYECSFCPITDKPQETEDGYITDVFMGGLEQIIKENPQFWLWTHRRWKLKKNTP